MDFLLANWMLILVALASGTMLALPMLRGEGAGLTPAAAVQLMNREKAVLLDLRSAQEFAAGHASGARHAPLEELEAKLPGLVKNKATPLVLMCSSGLRASRGVLVAKKLGYENVQTLAGGLRSWREANLPTQASKA